MILVPSNKVEKINYFPTLLGLIFIEINRGPLINYLTILYHLFWSSHASFGVSHCLRLTNVKLIGHPQIFRKLFKLHQKTQFCMWQLHFPKGKQEHSVDPLFLLSTTTLHHYYTLKGPPFSLEWGGMNFRKYLGNIFVTYPIRWSKILWPPPPELQCWRNM